MTLRRVNWAMAATMLFLGSGALQWAHESLEHSDGAAAGVALHSSSAPTDSQRHPHHPQTPAPGGHDRCAICHWLTNHSAVTPPAAPMPVQVATFDVVRTCYAQPYSRISVTTAGPRAPPFRCA